MGSPLTHVDRLFDNLSVDLDHRVMSSAVVHDDRVGCLIGMPPKRGSTSMQDADSGSDTEDDSDPIVQAKRFEKQQRMQQMMQAEQARKFGKQQMMQAREDRRKKAKATNDKRLGILNQYVQQGRLSITPEDRQWFGLLGEGSLDKTASDMVLDEYSRESLRIMARLPPGNESNLVRLKYWQMAKMGSTILETAAQMCASIVAEFQTNNKNPIRGAVNYTGSMKREITFDFSSVLPTAMKVPDSSIGSVTIQIYARTTPSKATAQLKGASVGQQNSAIKWSVLFDPNRNDKRIRQAVNLGLNGPGGRADSRSDDEQITIETQNGLNAALNELWERLLQYPYEPYAHAWNFAVPPMIPVTFGPSPVRNAPTAPPAPPAPAPAPPPGMLPGGWMVRKRKQKMPQNMPPSSDGGGSST